MCRRWSLLAPMVVCACLLAFAAGAQAETIGTVWSVSNQCNGTLTKVVRGVVSVRDFHKRKTVTLFTGQSYLAKAPGA